MMGAAPITQLCECGASGASIWLVDDRGQESTEPVCWDCAMGKRGFSLTTRLVRGGWHLTRPGALVAAVWNASKRRAGGR